MTEIDMQQSNFYNFYSGTTQIKKNSKLGFLRTKICISHVVQQSN